MEANEVPKPSPRSEARFPATQWSVVLAAGATDSPEAFAALSALCEMYRDPVYAWFRRHGGSPADADDLTQRFFTRIVEHRPLERFRRQGVPFRVFLKRCLRNLAINHSPQGPRLVPLEDETVETELGPDTQVTPPDAAFDEGWRRAILGSALEALRRESHQRNEDARFRVLAPLLGGVDKSDMDLAAQSLGIERNHANQLLYRLRQRYRGLILEEIQRTLPAGVDATTEMQALFAGGAP